MAFTVVSANDIPDGGASEAWLDAGVAGSSVVLFRRGDRIYAYRNLCPHAGRFLNWAPGRFLMDAGRLVCAAHGAVFEIEDGRCVDGPCRGSSLVPLAVETTADGRVRISD